MHDPSRFEQQRLVGPPDVVVEVSSPSTRRRDLQLKWSLYRSVGVPEYWVVDLDPQTIEVYRADRGYEEPTVFAAPDTLTSDELPGLEIQLAELFGR